jgi:hypothetical protein
LINEKKIEDEKKKVLKKMEPPQPLKKPIVSEEAFKN